MINRQYSHELHNGDDGDDEDHEDDGDDDSHNRKMIRYSTYYSFV